MWELAPRLDRTHARKERSMNRTMLMLVAALCVAAVGCKSTQQTSSTSSQSTSMAAGGTTTEAKAATGGKVHKLASGLQYEDLVVGSGTMAEPGMHVSVHYTGWLTNGTEFDSSRNTGQPLKFQLGTKSVIAGWDEGIKGMRIGGKRKLTIPPDMGYGKEGYGPIPPNATLLFDVELIDVK